MDSKFVSRRLARTNAVRSFFGAALVAVWGFGANAVAQEQQQQQQDKKPAVIESDRVGRVFSLDGGFGFSNGLAQFATVGVLVTPDWAIEGYYEQATTFFFGRSITRALRSKNYWNKTLYTNVGLMHRRVEGENKFLDMLTTAFTGKDTHYQVMFWDIGPEITVGNRWQWSAFYMGCDWVGVYWPLYTSSARITEFEGGSIVDQKNTDELKSDPSARLLRLYLGFTF